MAWDKTREARSRLANDLRNLIGTCNLQFGKAIL
jgi:hypothetical protein